VVEKNLVVPQNHRFSFFLSHSGGSGSWQPFSNLCNTNTMATIACNFEGDNHAESSEETSPQSSPLALMKTVIGECFCAPIGGRADQNSLATHFIELHGIEFIGLGAVTDELSPKERVYDTLEQLTERTERLISIGHLVDDEQTIGGKSVESIPLDIWNQCGANERTISRQLKRTIAMIKASNSIYGVLPW